MRSPSNKRLQAFAGYSLLLAGALFFFRAVWLGAMHFENMSQISRQRTWIALGAGCGLMALGLWLALRRRAQ
jgi:threonine/homoserine/homoserine lactone efflux protein